MNMPVSQKPPLALIAGPTASGKSALALRLAQAADGTIINADSAQVYRDLALISARPSAEEEALAPHTPLRLSRRRRDLLGGRLGR